MFAQPKDPHCPIAALAKYLSKLNPSCNAFFQRPKPKVSEEDTIWYENKPLGVHTINQMMKSISQEAGLSRTYTNHSVRATTATILANAGIESRDICAVTGHRNESSLKSYVSAPTLHKRHNMSHILHCFGKENTASFTSESDAVANIPPPGVSVVSCSNTLNTEGYGALFAGATFNAPVTVNISVLPNTTVTGDMPGN